jgi:2-isopropylmalate synthase
MSNDKYTRIETYDTTLRDGTQAEGVSLSLQDKLLIVEALDGLGIDVIEGGYPLSNPKDEAFFRDVRSLNLRHAKIAAFGMTRRRDIKAADDVGMNALLSSEAPVVTVVGKSWDLHVSEVLRVSHDENVAMIADSVKLLADRDRRVVYDAEHFFDGWRENPDYAMKTLRAALEAGADCLCLCDTNGGSTLDQVREIVNTVRQALPQAKVGIHCHNDSGLAVANSLVAVQAGARQVQGTINGIGERCGNADLTSIIPNLSLKLGYEVLLPEGMGKLTEVSRYVYEVANLNLRENQPFVGAAAFAHKGGMHVHAMQRNVHTYEHIDPGKVGNTRRILVSELSGMSNIAATAGKKFEISDDKTAQKAVLTAVMEMESQGYQFEAAEASFEVLVRKTLGGKWYNPLWELDHYRCMILRRNGDESGTEATVKIKLGDQVRHMVSEGAGPVDSLHKALTNALREDFSAVDALHLIDYKVRVVNTTAETAAKVRVMIDWLDQTSGKYFGSVGVSVNIIDASWLALCDAIEYLLLKS